MPALGNHLDFGKYEARNVVVHNGNPNPTPTPGTNKGLLWFNNVDNTLYFWNGTTWVAASAAAGGPPSGSAGGDLAGTYPNPTIGLLKVTDAHVAAANKDGAAGTASMRTLGTGATQAAAGNDSRLSDSRAPSGNAGGDLAGTYPNPTIAPGVIVNADVSATAAIARSKLDFGTGLVNADIATGAAIAYAKLALTGAIVNADVAAAAAIAYSKLALTGAIVNADIAAAAAIAYSKLNLSNSIVNADIGAGAAIALSKLATDPLARANHTGTQLAATISNFDTQVRTNRLDQMAAPTAAVALNAQKITGLADPTAGTDAANKQYVDGLIQGLDALQSVRVAYSTNQTLTGAAVAEGGVTPANGDRVLVMGQTLPAQNGIYIVNTGGAWARSTDADAWTELVSAYVFVEQGSNADNGFVSTVDAGGTIGTTAVTWVQFSGAGQITSGAGLTKTGNTLDVGGSSSITVAADTIAVATGGVTNAMLAGSIDATTKLTGAVPVANGGTGQTAQKAARETGLGAAGYYSSATHSAGATITITQATHGLRASRGLVVQAQLEADGSVVIPDVAVAATGDVTVTFGASQAANSIRVTVIG